MLITRRRHHRRAPLHALALAAILTVSAWFVGKTASASTQTLLPSDDTFINSGSPDNNDGDSFSIFTGTDGHGGVMRGLIRFDMPAGLLGRAAVTAVQLTMTVQALGDGTAGTGAVETLQAITQPWSEGNGFGNAPSDFVVGQPCGGAISGATWNQANCTTGLGWTTAGATVAASPSAQADTTGIPIAGRIVWSSATSVALISDVQGWIDAPGTNHGWRLASGTEGVAAEAQRFFSSESTAAAGPTLAITYGCKPPFVAAGTDCTAGPGAASVPAIGLVPRAGLAAALLGVSSVAASCARRRSRRS